MFLQGTKKRGKGCGMDCRREKCYKKPCACRTAMNALPYTTVIWKYSKREPSFPLVSSDKSPRDHAPLCGDVGDPCTNGLCAAAKKWFAAAGCHCGSGTPAPMTPTPTPTTRPAPPHIRPPTGNGPGGSSGAGRTPSPSPNPRGGGGWCCCSGCGWARPAAPQGEVQLTTRGESNPPQVWDAPISPTRSHHLQSRARMSRAQRLSGSVSGGRVKRW
jgi:hypothetical protein